MYRNMSAEETEVIAHVYERNDGLIVIHDNPEVPEPESFDGKKPDIYFHGHTLGPRNAVIVNLEQIETLISQINFLNELKRHKQKKFSIKNENIEENISLAKNIAETLPQVLEFLMKDTEIRIIQIERLQRSQRGSLEKLHSEESNFTKEIKELKKRLGVLNTIYLSLFSIKPEKNSEKDIPTSFEILQNQLNELVAHSSPEVSPRKNSPRESKATKELGKQLSQSRVIDALNAFLDDFEHLENLIQGLENSKKRINELNRNYGNAIDSVHQRLIGGNVHIHTKKLSVKENEKLEQLLNSAQEKVDKDYKKLSDELERYQNLSKLEKRELFEKLTPEEKNVLIKKEKITVELPLKEQEEIANQIVISEIAKLGKQLERINLPKEKQQSIEEEISKLEKLSPENKLNLLVTRNLHKRLKTVEELSEEESTRLAEKLNEKNLSETGRKKREIEKLCSFDPKDFEQAKKTLYQLGVTEILEEVEEIKMVKRWMLAERLKFIDPQEFLYKEALVDIRFGDSFIPVKFTHKDKESNLRVTYWSSAPQNSVKGRLIDHKPACYVMANCLFSGMLQGTTVNKANFQLIDHNLQFALLDDVVTKITHHIEWSPYEMVMFAQLEKQIAFAQAVNGKFPFTIRYHLPKNGYLLSGLKLFLADKLPLTQFKDYIDAVNQRSEAHRKVVTAIAIEAGIDPKSLIIESPFDNIDLIQFFRCLADPFAEKETETVIADKILQELITNDKNTLHNAAWKKVLPDNIARARKEIEEIRRREPSAKLPPTYERLDNIKNLEDLMHLANSMVIAFAHQKHFNDAKTDFKVVPFHSWDEKPIPTNYAANGLAKIFGEIEAVQVFPDVVYHGDSHGNNMFRVTPGTTMQVRDSLKKEIIKHYQPSEILEQIINNDNVAKIPDLPSEMFSQKENLKPLKENNVGIPLRPSSAPPSYQYLPTLANKGFDPTPRRAYEPAKKVNTLEGSNNSTEVVISIV